MRTPLQDWKWYMCMIHKWTDGKGKEHVGHDCTDYQGHWIPCEECIWKGVA